MKRHTIIILLALIAVGLIFVGITTAQKGPKAAKSKAEKGEVKYPDRYRYWTHVKSMVIQPGHELHDAFGGIHHIYANRPALNALLKGRKFSNGSTFVFDLFEAERRDYAIVEGAHKIVGVMQKHDKKYASTGGWGFEVFRGDTRERMVDDPIRKCFKCHESERAGDYVFSKFRP